MFSTARGARTLLVIGFGLLLTAAGIRLVVTQISHDHDGRGAPPNTVLVRAVADAYVNESRPSANTGTSAKLRVDGSPVVRALLRFQLQGVRGPIAMATLAVYATSPSADGFRVQLVRDNRWEEHRVSYATAPPIQAGSAASSGGFRKGSWVSVDITSLVRAAAATRDHELSIAFTSASPSALSLASRESGAHGPYITVRAAPANGERSTAKTSAGAAASGSGAFTVAMLGVAQVGRLLATSLKTPSNHVLQGVTFQWQLCDWTGGACAPISGSTRRRYRVGAGQLGRTLRVKVRFTTLSQTRALLSPPSTLVQAASDPAIAAAGDIACDPTSHSFEGGFGTQNACRQKWTSDLLLESGLSAVLPLGDTQYECGTAAAFRASYDRSWGRLKAISHPAIGNHEYARSCQSNDASAYFDYFGSEAGPAGQGWYSYDIGTWHLIALNSECGYGAGASRVGGCDAGSPEETWLKHDLATHSNLCTLAYWHEPRFSSGEHGDAQEMAVVWNDLVAAHADVVLSGHNHDYERFDPTGTTPRDTASQDGSSAGTRSYQNPVLDPNGIREFVVGTGGKNHYGFGSRPPLAGEVIRDSTTYGVLRMTLHPTGYDWRFVPDPASGSFTDSGTASCH